MTKQIYDTIDAMEYINRRYPFIPIWIIKRVLYANDWYLHDIGVIKWTPTIKEWYYTKSKKKSR